MFFILLQLPLVKSAAAPKVCKDVGLPLTKHPLVIGICALIYDGPPAFFSVSWGLVLKGSGLFDKPRRAPARRGQEGPSRRRTRRARLSNYGILKGG